MECHQTRALHSCGMDDQGELNLRWQVDASAERALDMGCSGKGLHVLQPWPTQLNLWEMVYTG